MTKEQFIKEAAKYVQELAPKFGIEVCSAPLSQLILESGFGTSELAVNAHNYAGLKYRAGRCPSCCGTYYKVGSEQNADKSYTSSMMCWFRFPDMKSGIRGYFEFINNSNYKSVKGVSDPETYLTNIKKAGYCTSHQYVTNCMNVIKKYNLTQYDNISSAATSTKENKNENSNKGGNKMRISISSGHNPDGKTACGAIGLIRESTEARKVKDKVIQMLKAQGHTVYDDTVDNGTSQNDVLKKIVDKVNSHKDLDAAFSIHFNAGAKKILDKKTTGTEIFIYSATSKIKDMAQKIVNNIAALGFKNRGVKTSKTLHFLRKVSCPAGLIEVAFVDDPDDVALYNANVDKIAQAIVKGITGVAPVITPTSTSSSTTTKEPGTKKEFKVKIKAGSLNIRAGAGTSYKVVGKITDKGIYTIVDTHGNWGKLKSGKGWINISSLYATRV